MSHWEDAIRAGADALPVTNHTSFADSRDVLTAADEHLHDHYLERIVKGQDDQADEALLEHYRLIVLREELEWAERDLAAARAQKSSARSDRELLEAMRNAAAKEHIRNHLRARVAELEGQKQ